MTAFIPLRKGKPLSTPKGAPLAVPSSELAQAIEVEWADVGGILPRRGQIPLTQYVNTAIDHISPALDAARGGFLSHANSELLCYRAEEPKELLARQTAYWQPWLDWVKTETGADFLVFNGIMPQKQSPEALAALRMAIQHLDAFHLLALSQAAGLTGSAILGLAMLKQHLSPSQVLELALLEEIYQSETWGEPEELRAKRDDLLSELEQLHRFITLLPVLPGLSVDS